MMSYKYGALMAGWGTFGFLTELVVLIDLILILLGIWLYKQITKEWTTAPQMARYSADGIIKSVKRTDFRCAKTARFLFSFLVAFSAYR